MLTKPETPAISRDGFALGHAVWLGVGVDYFEAWDLQRRLAAERAEGRCPDTLLLLEHAPVYTAGRRSLPEHLLGDLPARLVPTDRGGQVTYHGPGQLVGYPIVALARRGLGPKAYVCAMEAALVDVLACFGVEAWAEQGFTGVWTARGKIAAIGVKVTRGVAIHGFALNVTTDLTAYDAIVPCGVRGRGVTSIADVLSTAPATVAVREHAAAALGARLGLAWEWSPLLPAQLLETSAATERAFY